MTDLVVILVMCGSLDEARKMGRLLVEEKLAACATMAPQMTSVYRWQGEVCEESETMMLIKAPKQQVEAIKAKVLEMHSYDTPAFLVLPVHDALDSYGQWVHESCR